MTSRLRTRSHTHYGPDEYNPKHDPAFEQTVFDELIGVDALPIVGSEWQAHVGPRLCVDPWSLNDAVDTLRRSPFRLVIEGDRHRGYRVVGVERWRRRGT